MKKAHPGFKAVAAGIAKKQGISKERASAIVAAGARKASPAAVKANSRLKKVSGVNKGKQFVKQPKAIANKTKRSRELRRGQWLNKRKKH